MLQDKFEIIKKLKEELNQESYLKKEPFIKLGEGQAPFLNYNIPQSANHRAYQYWTKTMNNISADYTNLFINLVDSFIDGTGFSGSPNDQVTGYTLANIESGFLKHVYGLSSLSTILKANKPVGVTDAQIDLLLNSY